MNKYLYIAIAVLVAVVFLQHCFYSSAKEEVVNVVHTTDTVTFVKKDTVFEEYPVFKYEVVLDTMFVYINENDTTLIPVQQRYYASPDYELWISGYNPNLDSLKLFRTKEYLTITNTTEKTIVVSRYSMYANAGFWMINKDIMPYVGIRLASPNKFTFGADLGYYNKSLTYSFNVGYKLF